MKKIFQLLFVLYTFEATGQDTFSICAIDTITGETGSAGASCIDGTQIPGGVVIISDVHPGIGVIHTQAQYISNNQVYARNLMSLGLAPQQIIDSLIAHDIQNNPTIRQYGIVDFYNGSARVAAHSGVNCMNYKNHIIGPNYAIQGNILLGQQILDSMEARFLNEPGDLACKLMAALQGAKVPGADTRCLTSGNSSKSSFLRIACPGDIIPNYTLNIIVPQGPVGFEPIDSLQVLFDNIHNCINPVMCTSSVNSYQIKDFAVEVIPNPSGNAVKICISAQVNENYSLMIFSNTGALVLKEYYTHSNKNSVDIERLLNGIYFYKVVSDGGKIISGKLVVKH